ncbi:MAG: sodium-dependent transporter [Clostridia bacterium]|nr:sodium-dependent transporter [Clostridia bacterium]
MKETQASVQKKSSFTGSIGFVLAAAGSAVGLGNIWRFPSLAAKNGGGLFILIYIILALTFGFALLTTDIAIGRKTGKNPIQAYEEISKKWKFVGVLSFIVPAIILTYYSVVGGWILKYLASYVVSDSSAIAQDGYFTDFITAPVAPIVFMLVFLAATAIVVYCGVEKGIEKFSKFIMPGLLILIVVIAVFAITRTHTLEDGTVRTGFQGLKYYFIPNFEGITVSRFFEIVLDAMCQLFYSLSVSMGIMITYGSYVKKDVNLNKSVTQIEIFDTGVAILAGLMVIPTVFVYQGLEGMGEGAGLMFVALPKIFSEMGAIGKYIGIVFFVMVLFAALTSSVSIMETVVANCMNIFHKSRKTTALIIAGIFALASVVICLGYNVFYFELTLPNGTVGQLLDVMDYLSNYFLMPIISLLTCILVGWIIKPKWVIDEVEASGHKFGRKTLYSVIIKYFAPVMMAVLFVKAIGLF